MKGEMAYTKPSRGLYSTRLEERTRKRERAGQGRVPKKELRKKKKMQRELTSIRRPSSWVVVEHTYMYVLSILGAKPEEVTHLWWIKSDEIG